MNKMDRNSIYGISLDSYDMYPNQMNFFDYIKQEDYFEDTLNRKLYYRYIRELSNSNIIEMYFEETEGGPKMIDYDKNNPNIVRISEEKAKEKYPQYFI
jgi:RecA-family ATPase